MLKRIIVSSVLVLTLLFAASPVLAQFGLQATRNKAQYGDTSIYSTISTVISVGLSMAGLAFLGIMLYAGLRWMTARGDEEKITRAKDAMYAGIIGFVLVTLSYGISTFVFNRLIN